MNKKLPKQISSILCKYPELYYGFYGPHVFTFVIPCWLRY